MPHKDPSVRKTYLAAYRIAHREELAAKDRAHRPIDLANERRRRALALAFIDASKADGCIDCGTKNLGVLVLDHVRGIKVADVGKMVNFSLQRLFAEIEKCETRCFNCHQLITVKRRRA